MAELCSAIVFICRLYTPVWCEFGVGRVEVIQEKKFLFKLDLRIQSAG
jgi:hypothetical protein